MQMGIICLPAKLYIIKGVRFYIDRLYQRAGDLLFGSFIRTKHGRDGYERACLRVQDRYMAYP